MDNEYIQALRKEVKKEFTADKARYWHTIGVAETSACLAMLYCLCISLNLHFD